PERVVNLFETREQRSGRLNNMSYPDVIDLRDRSRTLTSVAARQSWTPTLVGNGDPVQLQGGSVSAVFFNLLGVQPVGGRVFDEGDGVRDHTPVVVIGHALWTERFGADAGLIERTIELSGITYEVVGVIPADFEDTDGPYVIWRADPPHFDVNRSSRTGHSYRPTARIARGYAIDDVNAELAQINADLVREYPEKTGDGMVAVPVMDVLVGESRAAIVVLFAAVSLLLLIACANVANLVLGRATTRRREIAVRTALGANPGRLVAQLLAESLVLAGGGGAAGVLVAWAAVPVFVGLGAAIPRAERVAMDPAVVGFAVAVTMLAGLLFGLAPALLAGRQSPAVHLRDGQRTADAASGWTLRNILVVGELSLSLVLLTGAGLLIRSFLNLQQVDKGIRTDHVLTMTVSPAGSRWPGHSDLTRYWEQVIAGVTAVPGVRTAGAVSFLPMSGGYEGQGIRRADRPRPEPGRGRGAEARSVTPDYFRSIGISVLRGRGFTAADDSVGPRVMAINSTLARQFFPGEDPLGKAIVVRGELTEIVGIVTDARQFGVEAPVRPEMYAPHAQPFVSWIRGTMDLVVHTDVDPLSIAGAVRAAVWTVDPTAPIANVKTMERWAAEDVAGPRFRTLLLGSLAAVALLLAGIGITGVLSYAVGRRTPEFGVRAALGATSADVVRIVLADGSRLIGIGVAVGLAASLIGARFIRSVLFGIGASDPITIVLVTGGVVLVSFVAMLVPAVRAGRVSPMVAMRAE
ncbi:MAG: ABC transporter permease, partial [Gemmatimonadales bacterium]